MKIFFSFSSAESTDDNKSMSLVAGVVMGVLLILLFILMATLILVHKKQGRQSSKPGEQCQNKLQPSSSTSQLHDSSFTKKTSASPSSSSAQMDQEFSRPSKVSPPLKDSYRTSSSKENCHKRISIENTSFYFHPSQQPMLYHTGSQVVIK